MARQLGVAAILIFMTTAWAFAADANIVPDRRKPQFQYDPGYYVFPMPYSIPGVGDGVGVVGMALNMGGSATDLYGFALAGGLGGAGIGVADIHLVPQTLILDFTAINFNKSMVTNYGQRGMDTDKYDYSYLQFGNYHFAGARLTSTFFERRFEVYGGGYKIGSELDNILDQDKNTILEVQDSPAWRTNVWGVGVRADLTDDYSDPRRGFRMDVSRWWSPPPGSSYPDFYRIEYNVTAYLPLGRRSTWLFNYFRSDAHVVRQGETDRSVIEQEQGLNCSTSTDPQRCNEVIDTIIAQNTYGTASSLGGESRLRSYPVDRFSGAHTIFYGTEVRWTLTEEARPFDIFIAKDVRTVLQLAAFYETGSVSDTRDRLGDVFRSSYGAGFRVVTMSGIVLRADVASGREGIETTVIFGYPWESF